MDCLKSGCPFRVNESKNQHRCECIACPNRCNTDRLIASDRTLSDKELHKFLGEG